MSTLIHLKYEFGIISNLVRSNFDNIEVLVNNSTKNSNSLVNDEFNIDNVLPITSENELKALEENLKIDNFKKTMVCTSDKK